MKWSRKEARLYREIGTLVAKERTRLYMTQQNLADAAGMARGNVANIEGGLSRVQVHTLALFAKTLRCSVSTLLP